MSELKELFNEIKSIFKIEGVDIENDSKEFAETTENNVEETTETVKEKFEDVVLADGTVAQVRGKYRRIAFRQSWGVFHFSSMPVSALSKRPASCALLIVCGTAWRKIVMAWKIQSSVAFATVCR